MSTSDSVPPILLLKCHHYFICISTKQLERLYIPIDVLTGSLGNDNECCTYCVFEYGVHFVCNEWTKVCIVIIRSNSIMSVLPLLKRGKTEGTQEPPPNLASLREKM